MKFTERLQGTPLENDQMAWIICAMLDWCKEHQVDTPSEREWCRILGCFPRGKARRGEEQVGRLPQSQVQKIMKRLADESIISMTKGTGRRRNTIEIPENANLIADKKAAYEARKEEWKKEVIAKLAKDVEKKTANWEGVRAFFEYWSESDADYNMRWENVLKSGKGKYFSIGGRWLNWKNKIIKTTTKEQAPIEKPKKLSQQEMATISAQWLESKGASTWTPELLAEWRQYRIDNDIDSPK